MRIEDLKCIIDGLKEKYPCTDFEVIEIINSNEILCKINNDNTHITFNVFDFITY